MDTLFDEISELVYVADVATYDLLFLNAVGREMFHVEGEEYRNFKCYQLLQHCDAPCSFCTNRQLQEHQYYAWEKDNPLVGRRFRLKDTLIQWEGRSARMEIAFDITEQERQRKKLAQAVENEKMIIRCAEMLHRTVDVRESMRSILHSIGTFLGADRTYILEAQDDGTMDNTYEWCAKGIASHRGAPQETGGSNSVERWREGFAQDGYVVIEDVTALRDSHPQEYHMLARQNIQRMIAAPLEINGRFLGVIGADNPPYDREEVPLIFGTIGYFLSSSIDRLRTDEALRRLSTADPLTGFYNRNRFMRDVERLHLAGIQEQGVVYVNINGLKEINDTCGHSCGDETILETAAQIRSTFGDYQVYRVGGDEFVVLCDETPYEQFSAQVGALRNAFLLDGRNGAAVGAQWDRTDNVAGLIAKADEKMCADKKIFYRHHSLSRRYRRSNDDALGLTHPEIMMEALRQHRFLVYLQPKISFRRRLLIGAEALIRYVDDHRGIVAPDQFIPTLEAARMTKYIDFFVFHEMCAKIQQWLQDGIEVVPISVNFSRYTLLEPDFIEQILSIWNEHPIPRDLIELEITESVEDVDGSYIIEMMQRIKKAGFKISIDDFGAKYANLVLFTNADIDTLKIDKSLIDDLTVNDKPKLLIGALVKICTSLGTQSIVEGVETEEQFRILRNLGCDGAQGYLFCRPIPIDEYEARVRDNKMP